MICIYVSGPLTDPDHSRQTVNVEKALSWAAELVSKGFMPIVPHVTYYVDQVVKQAGYVIPYDWFLHWDRYQLLMCDAMLVIGDSKGVRKEIEWASEFKLPIFYAMENLVRYFEKVNYAQKLQKVSMRSGDSEGNCAAGQGVESAGEQITG